MTDRITALQSRSRTRWSRMPRSRPVRTGNKAHSRMMHKAKRIKRLGERLTTLQTTPSWPDHQS